MSFASAMVAGIAVIATLGVATIVGAQQQLGAKTSSRREFAMR